MKAAKRLDQQCSNLGDKARFLLVNCAPALTRLEVKAWGEQKGIRHMDHFRLLGPAPKYRPSNEKAALIIQGLSRGYLTRKYNKYVFLYLRSSHPLMYVCVCLYFVCYVLCMYVCVCPSMYACIVFKYRVFHQCVVGCCCYNLGMLRANGSRRMLQF